MQTCKMKKNIFLKNYPNICPTFYEKNFGVVYLILIKISPREVSKYRKIRTRENSIFGQFLHSVFFLNFTCNKFCDFTKITQKREFYSVRMRKNAGKMRTRITPNTDIFYAVCISSRSIFIKKELFNWSFPDIL